MQIKPADYVEYIEQISKVINTQGEYITALDAATGDGDHWLNINIGYQGLVEKAEQLKAESSFQALLKSLAKMIMTKMGGTSGALYGSMYLAAAREVATADCMDAELLGRVLSAWAKAIMDRGNAAPGQKTMVDALVPAAQAYENAMQRGADEQTVLQEMAKAARAGAESTKQMEASRGRASNQPGRGIGHLDPGAVTMAIQLEQLADYVGKHCI